MTLERLTDDHVRYAVETGLLGSVVLADVHLPDDLALPDHLITEAREAAASDWLSDVISDHRRVPHRAEDWVACVEAKPHRDPFFRDHLFLTVTLTEGGHAFGDALSASPCEPLARGSVFVTDPCVMHWLGRGDEDGAVWGGLQWIFPHDDAPEGCRALIEELGGRWREGELDPRYADWRPIGTAADDGERDRPPRLVFRRFGRVEVGRTEVGTVHHLSDGTWCWQPCRLAGGQEVRATLRKDLHGPIFEASARMGVVVPGEGRDDGMD